MRRSASDEAVGQRRRLAAGGEVDHLHQGVGPLAGKRLGEAAHRAAQRRRRRLVAVAVLTAQASGGDQEGALATDRLAQRAHGGVEELHAPLESTAPGGQLGRLRRVVGVEGGQPVDAVDRPGGEPLAHLHGQSLGVGSTVDDQRLHAALVEPTDERLAHATTVGHDDHPSAFAQLDAGGLAQLQRRPQHRHRHAARHRLGGLHAALPAGHRGRAVCGRRPGGASRGCCGGPAGGQVGTTLPHEADGV
jgi:hypothetical protein